MEIIDTRAIEYTPSPMTHRSPGLGFKILFEGSDADPANNYQFAMISSRSFESPVHKHNFDQFRYAIKGDFNIGPHMTIRQSELCYHPEGVSYGPQSDDENERVLLLLQFGGASGQGYMGQAKQRESNVALEKTGTFEDGRYRPNDGGVSVDGFQALWEYANQGLKLRYPAPRYKVPVLMAPDNFHWTAVGDGRFKPEKASSKLLGMFSERQTCASQVKLEPQGSFTIPSCDGIQLFFVMSGKGKIDEQAVGDEFVGRLLPGAGATVTSEEGIEFLHYIIPTFD